MSIFGINPDAERGEAGKSAPWAPTLSKLAVHAKGRLNAEKVFFFKEKEKRKKDNFKAV